MSITLILVAVAVIIFFTSIRIIEQNSVAVVEFLGKYNRMMTAGFNWKIPVFERIAQRVSLRQQNFLVNGQIGRASCRERV